MKILSVERVSKSYRLAVRQRGSGGLLARFVPPALALRTGFREVAALRDVSFQVSAGEVLGIIGHNGAGKTTLLKTIGKITLPTSGRIVGRGRVLSLLGLGTGFQPDLSGRENIFLHGVLHGVPRHVVAKRFDDIVEFADLADFIDSPVRRYSSGMFLRLAFSIVINLEPDLILADEVLAVGDIEFQERCLQQVERSSNEGVAVLFVSHDMAAIRRLCHRVIRLQEGQIVDEGDPDQVVDRYQTVTGGAQGATGQATVGARSCPYATLQRLRLLGSEGDEIAVPRTDQPLCVEAVVETRSEALRLRPALALYAGDVLVCRSGLPRDLIAAEPGVYRIAATLPARLLAERSYTAELKVGVVRGDEITAIDAGNRLVFTVSGSMAGATEVQDLAFWRTVTTLGVVAPDVQWCFGREGAGRA